MPGLNQSISRFYHRWHALESALAEGVRVLDFDYCPRAHLTDLEPPFADRLEALRHVEDLRARLADAEPGGLCNAELMARKLEGSAAFLRALMGERLPFASYLRATMGIDPEVVHADDLAEMRDELERRLSRLGIPFSPEGKPAFDRYMLLEDVSQLGEAIRREAERWVGILQARVGLTARPDYSVEVVSEDAYWANWIDGSVETGIRLRINTHPRVTFLKGGATNFAVHEIGAHALQLLELDAARRAGHVDGAALNLCVHSCEQFQLEGLAQALIFLVAEEGEIPSALGIEHTLRAYVGALKNNAQIEVEEGRPIDEVVAHVLSRAPFTTPLNVLADLRDRSRHPLYRTYVHVYAPSMRKFLTARSLPPDRLRDFLRRMYTRLWTPTQIDEILKGLSAPGV